MARSIPRRRFERNSAEARYVDPKTLLRGILSLSKPVLKMKIVINGDRRVSANKIGKYYRAMNGGCQPDANLKFELPSKKIVSTSTKLARRS